MGHFCNSCNSKIENVLDVKVIDKSERCFVKSMAYISACRTTQCYTEVELYYLHSELNKYHSNLESIIIEQVNKFNTEDVI